MKKVAKTNSILQEDFFAFQVYVLPNSNEINECDYYIQISLPRTINYNHREKKLEICKVHFFF